MSNDVVVDCWFGPLGRCEFAAQPNSPLDPTAEAYADLSDASRFFNEALFGGILPDCLITLTRRRNALSSFSAAAFQDRTGRTAHELSINPALIELSGEKAIYAALVRCMAHLWRETCGQMNRKGGRGVGGYVDSVLASKLESIGLRPVAPDGKRTGYAVRHEIAEDGHFDLAVREYLIKGSQIRWRDAPKDLVDPTSEGGNPAAPSAPKNTRTRFVCAECEMKAWARASAQLACLACNAPLTPA